MDINKLKCVVGKVAENQPACIRLFGTIDEYNCDNFNNEFRWLEDEVKPSKIVVLINSEGGSCLYGMSVFSTINLCKIDTECVDEGLAASMASIIWTAGTRSYMRDYAILMIHNPFIEDGDDKECVSAFKGQLETIYRTRFGLSKAKVDSIMDGPEGQDGTYFSAQQAVDAGIIPSENVLQTCKQTRNKVKSQIDAVKDAQNIRKMMESVCAEVENNKLSEIFGSIHNQTEPINIKINETKMAEKNTEFDAIAAQLGFKETVASATVSAKIADLQKAEAKLTDVEAKFKEIMDKLTALQITNKGNEAKVANLQKELNETKASLASYQDVEKKAKEAEIAKLVDDAVKAGKIEDASKSQWIEMAHANLDMVKKTLASIVSREKISKAIADDPKNVDAAKKGAESEEAKLKEKVDAVIGSSFKFKKL